MITHLAALLCVVCTASASNPFAGQTFYVNPANQKEYDGSIATSSGTVKANLQKMRAVPSAYWIDKKEKINGNGTNTVEGILKDAASKSPPELVVLIFYDLPNRDCDAKASNGEICCTKNADGTCDYDTQSDCADGIAEYKSTYVDPFVSVLAEYKGKVPVVLVVEPDSLPNLASNLGHPHCGNSATQASYHQGIKYALSELSTKTDATLYLDAAHGGWLGWEDNLEKYIALLKDMALPFDRMRGFSTNVANYQTLGVQCPWEPDQGYRNGYCLSGKNKDKACCADPCKLESQYNPANNELNFAQALIKVAAGSLSWAATVIIDTGRNGVPDERTSCKNWCNPRNAGAGIASTSETGHDSIDAFFWLKTPGESDGCTQESPDGKTCPRYDSMCGSADSIGSKSGEPKSPEAGQWFDYAVKQLAANAAMGPTPPSPPAPPSPPSPTPPTPTPAPPTPPSPPSPTPSPSGCPGGSLSACLALCPQDDPTVFKACAKVCQAKCGGPSPAPPSPPSPTPPRPTPAPPAPTPSPPSPAPPSPSGCPGGSLSACLELCPQDDPTAFKACAKVCQAKCGGPSPAPPSPPSPTPTPPTPAPPTPAPPPTPPSPTPPSSGQCCYGAPGFDCGSATSCQGSWCGQSQDQCEHNCNGKWCPKNFRLVV